VTTGRAFRFSRRRFVTLAVVVSLGLALGLGAFAFVGPRSFDPERNRVVDEVLRVCAAALVGLSGALLLLFVRILRRPGLDLVVGDRALFVRLGAGVVVLARWDDVASVRVQRRFGIGPRVVGLALKDPAAHMASLPPLRRFVARTNALLRLPPVTVNPWSVGTDAETLRAAIEQALAAHTSSGREPGARA
jgi:hypothetical protein